MKLRAFLRRYPGLLPFSLAFFAFLLIQHTLMLTQHHEQLTALAVNAAKEKLHHLATLARDAAARRDYVALERLINDEAKRDPDIVRLRAVAPNGFVLALYQAPQAPHRAYTILQRVEVAGQEVVRLELFYSLDTVDAKINQSTWAHGGLSLGLALTFGVLFWWVLRRTAVQPLEREVAARRQAEGELKIFHRFTEATGQGLGMAELGGAITYVNRALADLLGAREPAELIGRRSFRQYYAPKDLRRLEDEILPEVLAKGQWLGEIDLRRLSGESLTTVHNIFLIRDDAGKPTHLGNLLTDISERKRTEAHLLRLETAIQQSLDGISVVTPDGIVEFVNQAWGEMHGWEASDLIGKHLALFHSPEQLETELTPLRDGLLAGGHYEGEIGHVHRDGHTFTTWMSVKAIADEAGRTTGMVAVAHDITERKRTEAYLARLESAVRQSRDGISVADTNGRVEFVNQAWAEMHGMTAEEAVGQSIGIFHPPHMSAEEIPAILAAARSAGYFEDEIGHARQDGSEFVSRITVAAIADAKGDLTGYVAVARDITARKKAERELIESREMLQAVLNAIPSGVFWKDLEGRYLGYNRRFAEDVGKELAAQITGKRDADMPWAEYAEAYLQDDQRVIQSESTLENREEDSLMNGVARRLRTTKVPLRNAEGRVFGVLGAYEDITERARAERRLRESEEQLRDLFGNLPDGMILVDPSNGRFLLANSAAAQMLGYKPDELAALNIEDIHPADELPEIRATLKDLADGVEPRRGEVRLLHRDGSVLYADATAFQARFAGRTCVAGSFRDTTERRAMITALEALNAQLEQRIAEEVEKNREKDRVMFQQARYAQMGEMLSMIAHQWRQPLTSLNTAGIELAVSNALGQADHAAVEHFTRYLEQQTQRMSGIIDDFMEFFRPDRAPEPFTLPMVMDDIRQLMGAQLSNRGIQLVERTAAEPALVGYRKDLEQVLINLIANARDAYDGSPRDRQSIVVESRVEGENVVIGVEDEAGGIPDEILERIFDPYFTTKAPGKGTGIGLYMSRMLVERNFQGRIRAKRTALGVRFCLHLPLKVNRSSRGST